MGYWGRGAVQVCKLGNDVVWLIGLSGAGKTTIAEAAASLKVKAEAEKASKAADTVRAVLQSVAATKVPATQTELSVAANVPSAARSVIFVPIFFYIRC